MQPELLPMQACAAVSRTSYNLVVGLAQLNDGIGMRCCTFAVAIMSPFTACHGFDSSCCKKRSRSGRLEIASLIEIWSRLRKVLIREISLRREWFTASLASECSSNSESKHRNRSDVFERHGAFERVIRRSTARERGWLWVHRCQRSSASRFHCCAVS